MGRRDRPERPVIGIGPILWIGLLIVFGLGMAVVLLVSTWMLVSEPGLPDELVRWGIVPGDQRVLAYADLSEQQDLSDGCLLTDEEAVQWEDRQVVAIVPLPGAPVRVDGAEVVIGAAATCRFASTGPARAFAARAARAAALPQG